MTAHDVDTLLAKLDPAADIDLPAPDSEIGRRIKAAALAAPPPRSHRRILVAVAALVLIATAAAVAIVLRSETPTSPRLLCFGDADPTTTGIEGVSGETDPRRACGGLWQDGPFADDGDIPPFSSCVLDGGGIGVFPSGDRGDTVCADVGLPVAVNIETLDPVVELDQRLRPQIVDQGCVAFDDFEAEVRGQVRALGLDAEGWTVDVSTPPTPERPCASYSIDTDRQQVVLVPLPDAG